MGDGDINMKLARISTLHNKEHEELTLDLNREREGMHAKDICMY